MNKHNININKKQDYLQCLLYKTANWWM